LSIANLTTERLILIPATKAMLNAAFHRDLNAFAQWGFYPGNDWPDTDTLGIIPKVLQSLKAHNGPTGFETWLIIKESDRTIIGDAGFKAPPRQDGVVDLGYSLIAGERGNGYATEAAAALVQWAFCQPAVKAVSALCLISNNASIRVLLKLGLTEIRRDDKYIYWLFQRPE
jgi:[ribosomal protein S5]-alanine N-acetyltransferase